MHRLSLFLTTSLLSAILWMPMAYAQIEPPIPLEDRPLEDRSLEDQPLNEPQIDDVPPFELDPKILRLPPIGQLPSQNGETPKSPEGHTVFDNQSAYSELGDTDGEAEADIIPDGTEDSAAPAKPDYSELSAAAEREARLTDLFAKLKDEDNPEDANLIAEEIWVVWLDSGSASINLVLRRGSDAQTKNKNKTARHMFDNVTSLSPEYAEGWARSSRLALEEKDFSRALTEAARALSLEPRHFYALWTLGNVFEQLGRQEEALEAYREANALYPELKAVKDRLKELESEVEGDVL